MKNLSSRHNNFGVLLIIKEKITGADVEGLPKARIGGKKMRMRLFSAKTERERGLEGP